MIAYHIYNDNGELATQCDNIKEVSEYLKANKKTILNRIADKQKIVTSYLAYRRHFDKDGFAYIKKEKIIQKHQIEKVIF